MRDIDIFMYECIQSRVNDNIPHIMEVGGPQIGPKTALMIVLHEGIPNPEEFSPNPKSADFMAT